MSDAALPTSMPIAADSPRPAPAIRLWYPITLIVLFAAAYVGFGMVDTAAMYIFFGRLLAVGVWLLLFLGWWLAQRRLSWGERLAVLGGMVAVIVVTVALMHPSVRAFALIPAFYAVPVMLLGWTAWLAVKRDAPSRVRRRGMIAVAALAWAWTLLVRMDGLQGQGEAEFHSRWTPTGEERFLADQKRRSISGVKRLPAEAGNPIVAAEGDWLEFRGPKRDGAVTGVTVRTDWAEKPPKQNWKRRVGPGWSSMVVIGDRLFTQEQREADEAVVCYDAATGDELWSHEDSGRFAESMGGVGPRATPTFADGRVYALGANGLLNCLDAATGRRLWSRDITLDGEKSIPFWGFCSSPLVVDGKVIVFAGGGGKQGKSTEPESADAKDDNDAKDSEKPPENVKTLIAYDAETGDIAWQVPSGSHSYSSPQLETIDGVEQVLFLSDRALQSVDPATGDELWALPTNTAVDESMPSLQPTRLEGSDFFVNFNASAGVVRTSVQHKDDKWTLDVLWFTKKLKPFFNDFVRVGEDLYGFDGKYFACVDAKTGKTTWKHKGYGSGQVVLLADQPILIVISEAGEAVLVAANPEKHEELGKFQAVEGKTWNHPTVVRGRLYVRSAEEMACYELQK